MHQLPLQHGQRRLERQIDLVRRGDDASAVVHPMPDLGRVLDRGGTRPLLQVRAGVLLDRMAQPHAHLNVRNHGVGDVLY